MLTSCALPPLCARRSQSHHSPVSKMSAYQFAGAAAALGGAAMVAMTFMQSNPEAEAKMPEEVKRNPLKRPSRTLASTRSRMPPAAR